MENSDEEPKDISGDVQTDEPETVETVEEPEPEPESEPKEEGKEEEGEEDHQLEAEEIPAGFRTAALAEKEDEEERLDFIAVVLKRLVHILTLCL